jgi:hypothetical protein
LRWLFLFWPCQVLATQLQRIYSANPISLISLEATPKPPGLNPFVWPSVFSIQKQKNHAQQNRAVVAINKRLVFGNAQ